VLAFYNDRGTAEQHIKEGKYALKWTRLSCMRLKANAELLGKALSGTVASSEEGHLGNAGSYMGIGGMAPAQKLNAAA
jgi:hypothetical protein